MDTFDDPAAVPLDRIREAARRVGRDAGCRLVLLFGSLARGDVPAADLDLGVLCDVGFDAIDVTNRMIRMLRLQQVDVTDLRRADPLVLMLAARDGIPLYEDPPCEFERFASLAARRYADTRKFREMERREIHDFIAGMEQQP